MKLYAALGSALFAVAACSTTDDIHVHSTEWVEISEGLHEGDRVLLAFSDAHKRLIPDLPPAHQRTWSPGQKRAVAMSRDDNDGSRTDAKRSTPQGKRGPRGKGDRRRRHQKSKGGKSQ